MSAEPSRELRSLFPEARFGEPCPLLDIAWAEKRIKLQLPRSLREAYQQCNGFRSRLNSTYLFPLIKPAPEIHCDETSVGFTLFARTAGEFNRKLTRKCFFFGGPGNGDFWGLHIDHPGQIVLWNPRWDEEAEQYEIAGIDPVAVWANEERKIADILVKQANK